MQERNGILVENPVRDRRAGVARKCFGVGEQLVEDHADRKQIGAAVDILAENLFGRHVARRPDGVARVRDGPEHSSDAEVEHLQAARLVDHQVGRLDVAVNDRHPVRVAGRGGELFDPAQLVGLRDGRLAANQLRQRFALDVLHDDVRLRLVVAEVVHRDDVGVSEGGRRTRLAHEAFSRIGDVEIAGEHLDGDETAEDRVVRGVDGAHAAAPEPPLDFVTPYL